MALNIPLSCTMMHYCFTPGDIFTYVNSCRICLLTTECVIIAFLQVYKLGLYTTLVTDSTHQDITLICTLCHTERQHCWGAPLTITDFAT